MWSLTLLRAGRTRRPEKFRSSARRDFFNDIRQKRPLRNRRWDKASTSSTAPRLTALDQMALDGPSYGCSSGPSRLLRLRNLGLLGPGQMDDLLKAHN